MPQQPKKPSGGLTRIGGLVIIAAVVGGLVAGISLLTLLLLGVGVVLVIVGLILPGRK